jgi:DNA polymerase-3 subunit alpha
LEAISHPKNIVKKAKAMGLPALAITDYNGMYGAPAFYLAAKDAEIKAILGVELGFVLDLKGTYLTKNIGNVCLLAITDEGYYNLMKLTSFANQEGIEGKPKIDFTILKDHHQGVLIFYGGTESRVGKMISLGEQEEKIVEIHEMIQEVFKENCYFEITAQDEDMLTDLPKINQLLLHLARKTDTKCIVNNNYCYPEPKDKPAREMALAIKDNMKMYDPQRRQPVGLYHVMTEQEIKEICLKNGYKEEQIDERIANNENIAQQVHIKMKLGQALFPMYESPDFIKELYEQHKEEMIENINILT